MEKQAKNITFLLLLLLSLITLSNETEDINTPSSSLKLFVFGDSYVDTGNFPNDTYPWRPPNGMTVPGHPTGRFSDGLNLADHIAMALGLKLLIPSSRRNKTDLHLQYGLNFAYGGAGASITMSDTGRNLSSQIDDFKTLVKQGLYTKRGLHNSVGLLSDTANDWTHFFEKENGTIKGVPAHAKKIIKQLVIDLQELHKLGVKKVVAVNAVPRGCWPDYVSNGKCNETYNQVARYHNHLLKKAVQRLNNGHENSTYGILDLYTGFLAGMDKYRKDNANNTEYNDPLKACYVHVKSKSGEKSNKVCSNPKLSFFWDVVHPSHNGWIIITSSLKPTIQEVFHIN